MPYPPDSWLVSVWVETGIVGLLFTLPFMEFFCLVFVDIDVQNTRQESGGLVAAWVCMNAGFFIAAYVSDVMQYPNQLPIYIGFALCFAAPHIEKRMVLENKKL